MTKTRHLCERGRLPFAALGKTPLLFASEMDQKPLILLDLDNPENIAIENFLEVPEPKFVGGGNPAE